MFTIVREVSLYGVMSCDCHVTAVFQAVCLEELSVHGLLVKLLEKVVRLDVQQVSSFVRVTAGGVCVQMDDTVVLTMQDEASFVLQAVKRESSGSLVVTNVSFLCSISCRRRWKLSADLARPRPLRTLPLT